MLMILPKTINKRFYKTLREKKEEYGRGFNKFLCGETGYSTGYISQVLNDKQGASQEAQIKISNACELDYKSFFLEIPQELIKQKPIKEDIDLRKQNKLLRELNKMKDQRISDLEKLLEIERAR